SGQAVADAKARGAKENQRSTTRPALEQRSLAGLVGRGHSPSYLMAARPLLEQRARASGARHLFRRWLWRAHGAAAQRRAVTGKWTALPVSLTAGNPMRGGALRSGSWL